MMIQVTQEEIAGAVRIAATAERYQTKCLRLGGDVGFSCCSTAP